MSTIQEINSIRKLFTNVYNTIKTIYFAQNFVFIGRWMRLNSHVEVCQPSFPLTSQFPYCELF